MLSAWLWTLGLTLLAAQWGIGAAVSSETDLPFKFSPLIQSGSGNLLPTAFSQWDRHGAAQIQGGAGIDINLLAQEKKEPSGIHVDIAGKPQTLYELSFHFRTSDDLQWDYADDNAGLEGWLVASANGKEAGSARVYSMRRSKDLSAYQLMLFTPAGTDRVSLQLSLHATRGEMLLKDVSLREAPVAADEHRQVLETGGKSYAELARRAEPAEPSKLTIFGRADPDQLFFYSHPTPEELGRAIQLIACPGEVGVSAVGVYAPTGANLSIEATTLTNSAGDELPAPTVSLVHFNPRRNDYYGRGATWHWVADTLSAAPRQVTGDGTTLTFWLKVSVAPQAKPGVYQGRVVVHSSGNADAELPMRVQVNPFQLADTGDKHFGLYVDANRWKKMTDEQVQKELADIKAHGIDSLELPEHGEPRWADKKVVGWDWDELTLRVMPMIGRAGLAGPFRVWLEWLPESIARKLGVHIDGIAPKDWPEDIAAAYRDTLRAIQKDFDDRHWGNCVFEGIDEPGYWKPGSPDAFAWQYGNAVQTGMATYCTSSYLPSDPLGKFLTYHCYTGRVFDGPERSAIVVDATRQAGQTPWMYATGSYSGQVGNIVHNRYGSGFIFWRTGADGLVSWTFQRPRGNELDDFAGPLAQPLITLNDPDHPGDDLDTPQWEGLRQGWLDYRYASTAAAKIADAARRGAPEAQAAKKDFDAIFEEMPWDGTVFSDCPVTNQDCDRWRAELAEIVVKLGKL